VKFEREAKLVVEPGFRMPDLSSPGVGLRGEPESTERFVSTYHDTEDLRLVRWGAVLRYRAAEGWTVKLPQAVDGPVVVRQEHTFEGNPARAPAGAVDLTRGIARGGTVGPVVRLQTVRHRTRIARGAGNRSVAQVVDDEVSVLEGRRIVDRFREVEVELDEGVEGSVMIPILALLTDAGASVDQPLPKVVRALDARAAAPPDVVVPQVGLGSSVSEVARWVLAVSTERLIAHDAAVRVGDDPEGVHQARVAARRLRSGLLTLRPMLDRSWCDALRAELGWFGDELGRVRDVDVLGQRLRDHALLLPDDDASSVARVLDRLWVRREAARTELLSAMREPRYVALLDSLVEAAQHPRVLEESADVPAIDVVAGVMEAPWARLHASCRRLDARSTDVELHEARIRAKRVRYAAEALVPVFGKPAKRFARRAGTLQQVFGDHQDAVMAIAWLREQAGGATPRVAFTAGRLAGIEATARDEARRAWPAAWADLRRKRWRFWS